MLAVPKSYSPDGRFLLYSQINADTGSGLLAIPLHGDRKPFLVAQTQGTGEFSPDGHWVAYTSNESGLSEIYVIPFPPTSSGGKWMVSRGGGVQPRWRRDGKELFFVDADRNLFAVEIKSFQPFVAGSPTLLFQSRIRSTAGSLRQYEVSRDGKQFLINSRPESNNTAPLVLVNNWQAGMKR